MVIPFLSFLGLNLLTESCVIIYFLGPTRRAILSYKGSALVAKVMTAWKGKHVEYAEQILSNLRLPSTGGTCCVSSFLLSFYALDAKSYISDSTDQKEQLTRRSLDPPRQAPL